METKKVTMQHVGQLTSEDKRERVSRAHRHIVFIITKDIPPGWYGVMF